MSLEAFEDAWIALMLDPPLRAHWRAGTTPLPGLSPAEAASLAAIPDARMEATARAVTEGRIAVFLAALPARVSGFLPPERWRALAAAYAERDPLASLYPLERSLPQWLTYLAEALRPEAIPHLTDVLAYEALQQALKFYRLPQPAQQQGPSRLAASSGLLVAGPQLREVLARLDRHQSLLGLEQTPRQGYLLRRLAHELELSPVHWAVYELLHGADGSRSWSERLETLCLEHPELAHQRATLLAWEAHFLDQGVLTDAV